MVFFKLLKHQTNRSFINYNNLIYITYINVLLTSHRHDVCSIGIPTIKAVTETSVGEGCHFLQPYHKNFLYVLLKIQIIVLK